VTVLVTGAAGFIGSTLVDALLDRGDTVRGVDCFTTYYDPARKAGNLEVALGNPSFELVRGDLRQTDLQALLDGVDLVFHLAAQPGVRLSWSEGFSDYVSHNVLATQRLLDAIVKHPVRRFVYASSSSVYGNTTSYPTREDALPAPHSPYGVTKLAGEHLCGLYAANWGLPTVALRYFTVYGPRQRPDMAINRLIEAALGRAAFPLYGDGSAVRDFTYVDDVVGANLAASQGTLTPGTVVNVAGGSAIAMSDLIAMVEEIAGCPIRLDRHPPQSGDVDRTGGSIDRCRELLGWSPRVPIEEGVARQFAWQKRAPD
jgi:UDP-glucuronate 4-epimerase